MDSRYIIGIDLGTTNSVVSYMDTTSSPEISVLSVPQAVAEGQVAGRSSLPSFLYLPGPHDAPRGSFALPWDVGREFVAGELARERGAKVPGRLVSSAKSWLCHAAADRSAPILPWGAPDEVPRLSPVEASARYLEHICEAWNHTVACDNEDAAIARQNVILTVPASFDSAARDLTVQAARRAGLENLVLIEEPQAAFYAWLLRNSPGWEEQIQLGETVLVCDVGGGTTDFSLIQAEKEDGCFGFRRLHVGDHLMLGGDNMDLALAARIENELLGDRERLDAAQWSALQAACREAKEALLSREDVASLPVVVPGRGSRLVGGTLQAELDRGDIESTILDGFFPNVEPDAEPARRQKTAIQEFGLPYAQDPAITRHLAAFLRDANGTGGAGNAGSSAGSELRPQKVLFNGGVFKAGALQKRVLEVLRSWYGSDLEALSSNNNDLDRSVALGAAYYGMVRRGEGVRIGGGTARSLYIGFDLGGTPSGEPHGGEPHGGKPQALCIAPQGMQEGRSIEIAEREFELKIRQAVSFPYFSSRKRPLDEPGDIVAVDPETMRALPPICTVLTWGKKTRKAETVRVRIRSVLTEVGVLEIWCVSLEGSRRWRLEFDVRRDSRDETAFAAAVSAEAEAPAELELVKIDADRLAEASRMITRFFTGAKQPPGHALHPDRLMRTIEEALGMGRLGWPVPVLRTLWESAAIEVQGERRKGLDYELRWLNLTGFLLRPGFGDELDGWRATRLWPLFNEGLIHPRNGQARAEWWTLWRRVAGGLDRQQQAKVIESLSQITSFQRGERVKKINASEEAEMWRTAASLERLPAGRRHRLGKILMRRVERGERQAWLFWALGRLGARVPFYGPIDTVVDRATAIEWIERLLAAKAHTTPEAAFALVQIARRTGDRARDIDEKTRSQVLEALRAADLRDQLMRLVAEIGGLEREDQVRIFGESLPAALRLVS